MNLSYSNRSEKSSCPRCGTTDLVTKERPPHIGLYCRGCGGWIRWLPRNKNIELEAGVETKPSPTGVETKLLQKPAEATNKQCDHCTDINALLVSLNRVDRHLEIVTRALINGFGR
jgi:late competence protein required for DNA uptake (superfamily II DNA/RNA helicase)